MKTKKQDKLVNTGNINFGIFPGECFVCIGATVKQIAETEPDKKWKQYFEFLVEDGMTTNFCNESAVDGLTYYSLFIEEKKDDAWFAKLAHELLHLCQFICKTHVLNMIEEKESVAYLHTHLMNQVLQINKPIK